MRENGASIQGHDLKFPLKGVYSSGITESNLKGKKKYYVQQYHKDSDVAKFINVVHKGQYF